MGLKTGDLDLQGKIGLKLSAVGQRVSVLDSEAKPPVIVNCSLQFVEGLLGDAASLGTSSEKPSA